MSGNQINLNDALPPRATLKIDPQEDPTELAARVRAESRRKFIDDCKGVAVFVVILLGLLFLGVLAAYEGFFNSKASPEVQHWGVVALTTLLTSSVTFLLGRAVGKSAE